MSESLPKISESAVPPEHTELVQKIATDAALFLKLDAEASPHAIVEHVDDYIHKLQKGKAPPPEGEDLKVFFGCLWGEQLVREFGWEWANVTFHDYGDTEAMGVFSKDRSLAIYPFHFIAGCLENDAPVTIMLAFNMLLDGTDVPTLPPRAYENVMDNVHHIVPRD